MTAAGCLAATYSNQSTSPKTVVYRNKNIIFDEFTPPLTEIVVKTNPQVNLDNLNVACVCPVRWAPGGLSAFFMTPDGRTYSSIQCSALSIMSHTLIPKAVGTGCRFQFESSFSLVRLLF